jgi:integrase
MNPLDEMWESADIELTSAQQATAPRLRAWLRTYDLTLASRLADLSTQGSPLTCTENQMEELQKNIELQFGSCKASHEALVVLGKFIAFVNGAGRGTIPQPRISNLVVKPPNPFRNGVAHDIQCVRTWLGMERRWIKECAVAPPVELVVLSAILHGGLLNVTSVVHFIRALLSTSIQAFGCIGNRVHFDLALGWSNEPDMEDRRWYPDDQTAALIRRSEEYGQMEDWQSLNTLADHKVLSLLFRKIRGRMRSDNVQQELHPSSLKQLIDIVATAARTQVPAVLIEYCTRRIVAHSVKFDVLQRLSGVPVTSSAAPDAPSPDDGALLSAEDASLLDEDPIDIEPKWLKQLRAALSAKNTQTMHSNLQALLSTFPEPSCPGHRITYFALYLLTERHRDRRRFVSPKPLALRTVAGFTLAVARRFGCMLGEQDPVELTSENLETLYTKVLENVVEGKNPQQLRRKVANTLREFHEFLVCKLHANPIDDRSILGTRRGLVPVDAKIVTPEEYSEARRILRHQLHRKYDRQIVQAAEVILILGFRCGTRRMEAYGLEFSDLTHPHSPLLLIRPTEDRQLKTDNAKRQLQLWCLMAKDDGLEEDELKALYSWKHKRIEDGLLTEDTHLFAVPSRNESGETVIAQLSVQKLIEALHEALRRATGDRTLHYHHLRHSFATWTFLRLMLSDLPKIPDLFPHLPETTAWLRKSKAFRNRLYGTSNPTRKHAMAVASLLGHSGPGVSLEHYIHCMDWLVPQFIHQSKLLGIHSMRQVALASGLPESTIYEWKKSHGISLIPALLFRQRFPERVAAASSTPTFSSTSHILHPVPQRWVEATWDLLFLSSTTVEPFSTLADRLGFDSDTARAILDRAQRIQQIKEPRGKQPKRHRMESTAVAGPRSNTEQEFACPWRPKSLKNRKIIQDLELQLWQMTAEHRTKIGTVLGYYVNNVWSRLNMLLFRNPETPEDAVRYRTFLNHLGIGDVQIRFIDFNPLKRSRLRSQWKKALKLTWRHRDRMETLRPLFERSPASDRWFAIEPDFRGDGPGKLSGGSNGFRFLMVMAAIRFGWDNQLPCIRAIGGKHREISGQLCPENHGIDA